LVEHQLIPYARVRELLADLLGAPLSEGTLLYWVQQGAETLVPVEEAIKAVLIRAPVLHSDETGVRRAGQLAWAHVASTARLTHYAIHAKRGREATDAIGILPAYQGVSVHDGLRSYGAYTACRHALCNIHHLRELTFVEETFHQVWATKLKGLLLEMKVDVEQARARGETRLTTTERGAFVACYEELMAEGLAANPPPEPTPLLPGLRHVHADALPVAQSIGSGRGADWRRAQTSRWSSVCSACGDAVGDALSWVWCGGDG
jgi:transposase